MDLNNVFAQRLRELMQLKNINQAEFCRRTGINKASVCRYMQGVYVPKDENIRIIANTFGVSVDWLRGRSDDMYGNENAPTQESESIPAERAAFIEEIKNMNDAEFERLKKILDLF